MSHRPSLPAGLVSRPLHRGDSRAVFELMAADQSAQLGQVEIEEADIVGDWARPSWDLASCAIGVFDSDGPDARMIGYGELTYPDRYDAAVHPDAYGRGIGTAIAGWVRDLARSRGADIVGMPVPAGSAGDRLLTALGYGVRWHSWVLELPRGAQVPARALPPGHQLREASGDRDLRAIHEVIEDAFLEWSRRDRQPYQDFLAQSTGRPGHQPWHMRLIEDHTGTVVAAAVLSDGGDGVYVNRVAVRRDQRNRGLAQALLVDSFAAGRDHGAQTCVLSTDSRTGALSLYQRVGMVVTQDWVHRAIPLTARGRDLLEAP